MKEKNVCTFCVLFLPAPGCNVRLLPQSGASEQSCIPLKVAAVI